MRNSQSSLRNSSVCTMLNDMMGRVLYSLIWVPRFKPLLLPRVQWKHYEAQATRD